MFCAHHSDEITILLSDLLTPFKGLVHGFSTRQGGVSLGPYASLNLGITDGDLLKRILINRRRFCNALNFAPSDLAQAEQIHSNKVLPISTAGINHGVDGLMTNQRGIFLSVKVADCAPILFFDPDKEVIAAIHAGWRGTLAGIIANTVEAMNQNFGSQSSDLRAAIGPALHACCYEVKEDVAGQFAADEIIMREGKLYLDLIQAIRHRLIQAGLRESNLDFCELCTACNPHLFYSHRRDKGITGRMMAVIGLNGTQRKLGG